MLMGELSFNFNRIEDWLSFVACVCYIDYQLYASFPFLAGNYLWASMIKGMQRFIISVLPDV